MNDEINQRIIKENINSFYKMEYAETLDKDYSDDENYYYKHVQVKCNGTFPGDDTFFIENHKDLNSYISATEQLLIFLKSLKIEEGDWSEEIPRTD